MRAVPRLRPPKKAGDTRHCYYCCHVGISRRFSVFNFNIINITENSSAFSALTLLVWRQEGHPVCKKTEWWGAGVVICLELGADLHIAQLMPLPLTVSCSSKIQIGVTFLVPAHPGSPLKRAVKRAYVRMYATENNTRGNWHCCIFSDERRRLKHYVIGRRESQANKRRFRTECA